MFLTLLLGIGVLLVSILSFGIVTSFVVHLAVWLNRIGYTGQAFWKNVALMTTISLVITAVHLLQIALWAVVLVLLEEFPTFDNAFYCSAGNYTSLGSRNVGLSEQWRLLGPLETVNGMLAFGLSTAVMFGVTSHLFTTRIRADLGAAGRDPS